MLLRTPARATAHRPPSLWLLVAAWGAAWGAAACQSEPSSTPGSASRAATPAHIVLRGGSVYTLDAARPWARALAIRDGVLTYVGSESGVEPFIGEATRLVELAKRSVLPSFQACHIHPIYSGVQAAVLCDLSEGETEEQYVKMIADWGKRNPEASWIDGGGGSMSAFPAGIPDRRLIDAVVSYRPVHSR